MDAEQRRSPPLAVEKPFDRFIWNAPARDQRSDRPRHRQFFVNIVLSAGD
jgi:hypothetical protein